MNVTVNRAEFLAAAKRAASVAPLSSPLEPLRGILLETDRREGCLTISATNLEVSLVQTIPCTSLDADALVLNARLLEGMLDKLEGDSVTPVSYTHLDVYKRQPQKMTPSKRASRVNAISSAQPGIRTGFLKKWIGKQRLR